jgi:ABC-type transporter Mla subunit MlaD
MSVNANRLARRLSRLVPIAALVVVVAVWAGRPTTAQHHLSAVVPDAADLIHGQEVRIAGTKIGSVDKLSAVDGGRATRVELAIDDAHWPLPTGTKLAVRWGGTISYNNRYVAVTPPARAASTLAEDATIPARDFWTPQGLDQLLTAFTPRVRADTKALIDHAGASLLQAKPVLPAALRRGAPTATSLRSVLSDVDANERALDTLVRSGAAVTQAMTSADPGLGRLVQSAGTTLDTVASEADSVQTALQRAPGTFTRARTTLAVADQTLTSAGELTGRIAPGVAQVRRIAAPLNSLLRTVNEVSPTARKTLATVRKATPQLNPLLRHVQTIAPELSSISTQADTQLDCLRPYTPDIVSFFTNWSDMISANDGRDKYIRANVQEILPAPYNLSYASSGDLAKSFPGLRFGLPRPPGTNAGQPWYLPGCGAGAASLDPAKDREARPGFDLSDQLPGGSAKRGSRR